MILLRIIVNHKFNSCVCAVRLMCIFALTNLNHLFMIESVQSHLRRSKSKHRLRPMAFYGHNPLNESRLRWSFDSNESIVPYAPSFKGVKHVGDSVQRVDSNNQALPRSALRFQGRTCGDSNEELYVGYLKNQSAESSMIQPQLIISYYHPVQGEFKSTVFKFAAQIQQKSVIVARRANANCLVSRLLYR